VDERADSSHEKRGGGSHEREGRPAAGRAAELREQASHVRHELRGALAVLYPALSALRSGGLSDGQGKLLAAAERAATRLEQMVASFGDTGWLEVCSPSAGPAPVDLAGVIESSLRGRAALAGPNEAICLANVPEGLPAVFADEAHVRVVLGALLDNAARFSPPGGVVLVSASGPGDSRATPPASPRAPATEYPAVRVTVSDRGPGVDAGDLEAIFAFGHRGDNNPPGWAGLGIGLYAGRELVDSWGGSIAAQPAAPSGLAVTFTVPVVAGAEGPGLA
jgi:signal transduction histidine kinase